MDLQQQLSPEAKARIGLEGQVAETQAPTETVEGFFDGDKKETADPHVEESAPEVPRPVKAVEVPAGTPADILEGTGSVPEATAEAEQDVHAGVIMGNVKVGEHNAADLVDSLNEETKLE